MKSTSLLLALEDDYLRQDITNLLSQSEAAVSEQDPREWKQLIRRVQSDRPEILLIELNAIRTDVMEALQALKKAASQTKIIALHPTDDPASILAAMRAGASEFVHPPYEQTFGPALERVIGSCEGDLGGQRRGKVIGFVSAKGGCGATTLACHIAADLRRQTGQRALLADLDFTSGMVGFVMKVASTYSVLDAVSNLSRLDESLWKALVVEGRPGLDVIPSPENFSHENAPSRDDLRQVIRFMRTQHDWVVLDLGRSLNEVVANIYSELDELLLVSVLEVTALHGLKSIAQKLRDSGEDLSKLELVLNRTPKMMEITQDDLQKVLGRPLYAMLPNDYPSLYEAYSAGTLLAPKNRLAVQFSTLTAKLAGNEKKPAPKKKFSLFK
jgi:pilus assembly protein CpaE